MLARTFITSLLLFSGMTFSLFSHMANAIELNGEEVPKEKFIVFILIGHSNMVGRNNDCDTEPHPRAWNYKIDDNTDAWVPAQGPIFYDGRGKKDHGTYIGCGPGMPLLKRLVEEFPDTHFGVIEYAWSGGQVKQFRRWGKFYRKLAPHIKDIKSDVTFGGMLAMLGRMERYDPDGFADSIKKMVRDYRKLTDSPTMPYFQQRERPYDDAAKKIRVEQDRVAEIVPHSAVIQTDGPDLYKGHYGGEAERLWANEAVDIMLERGWLK